MGRITIFSITICKHCQSAKTLLKKCNIPYTEINLDIYPERRKPLAKSTGSVTVPQIYFNGMYIGGNDSLQTLFKKHGKDEFIRIAQNALDTPDDPSAPHPPDPLVQEQIERYSMTTDFLPEMMGTTPEIEKMIKMMRGKGGISITNRRRWLHNYFSCFIGSELVTWMVKNKQANGRLHAVEIGTQLLNASVFHHVSYSEPFQDGDFLYRFQEDEINAPLNMTRVFHGKNTESANVLAEDLRRRVMEMYNKFLSSEGKSIDYKALAASSEFQNYVLATTRLQTIDIKDMDISSKKAFFINIYNALVIHASIVHGKPKGFLNRRNWFRNMRYRISGLDFGLDDIEHGILRGNQKPPGGISRIFGTSNPKREYAMTETDPRIHFALVCGAKGCPPIALYSPDNVDEALSLATRAFLESELSIDCERREVWLSKIFSWYAVDFGTTNENVLSWICKYVDDNTRIQLKQMLTEPGVTVKYLPYDWESNETVEEKPNETIEAITTKIRPKLIINHVKVSFEPKKFGIRYQGNVISHISPGLQAEHAGVKLGWVIISINGHQMTNDRSMIKQAIQDEKKKKKRYYF